MKTKVMLLPLSLALFLAIAVPSRAEFLRVTLAGITPGETTTEEFRMYLQENGCQYEVKGNSIDVKPGCFHLPGNPTITVGPGYNGKADVIGQMTLTFPNDRNENFNLYFEKLSDKYGKPVYNNSALDYWVATWRLPDQSYILIADNNKHTGTLIMGTDETYKNELKSKFPAAYQVMDLDEI